MFKPRKRIDDITKSVWETILVFHFGKYLFLKVLGGESVDLSLRHSEEYWLVGIYIMGGFDSLTIFSVLKITLIFLKKKSEISVANVRSDQPGEHKPKL